MFDYMELLNLHAFNQLNLNADIPDNHLMIGNAEDLTPQIPLISQAVIPKDVADNLRHLEQMNDEDVEKAINDGILEVNDFNGNTAIIEELLGVFK